MNKKNVMPENDGIPKVKPENTIDPRIDDTMDTLVNLDEFTQMGDEEDHESI